MNKRNWEQYKKSDEGKRVIALFDPAIVNFAEIYKFTETPAYPYNDGMTYAAEDWDCNMPDIDSEIRSREDYEKIIDELEFHRVLQITEDGVVTFEDTALIKADDYRRKVSAIHFISLILYYRADFFKPLLHPADFNTIQTASSKLGIELPAIPHGRNYRDYLIYYYDICIAFYNFQQEYGLTDAEFCACLYDYASTLGDEEHKVEIELPTPTNIWLTGASKEDIAAIERNGNADEMIWACKERTRRGDIVILYALAPHSCIHSIWRASTSGLFNPFDYYQNRTIITNGVDIPHISNKELKAHQYFSQLPIVKKNMQGVSGVELSAKDYIELLALIAEKGFDTAQLPNLAAAITDYVTPDVEIEKDVEDKILTPLLTKLGYSESDYTRQLAQKAGRKMKVIPDFVFFPKGEEHFQTAPLIIEAKYDMGTVRGYSNAFTQALSYARILRSDVMGICDKERLVLYDVSSGTARQETPIFEQHWAVIYTDTSTLNRLVKLIGKETMLNKKSNV